MAAGSVRRNCVVRSTARSSVVKKNILPVGFRFLWPCIVSKVWRQRKKKQDAIIRCLLLTSVSTCFGHHYAHLQENKGPVTAFGVMFWFCWMWLVAVVGRCLVGCEHCSAHILQDSAVWVTVTEKKPTQSTVLIPFEEKPNCDLAT